jgi:adenine phosphoribosyltransferase
MDLKQNIRDIPDFPKKGILFHDVTTLFGNPDALKFVVDALYEKFRGQPIRYVAGIEARGFLLAGALAIRFGCGVIPVRKPGKLPFHTISETYELEYGTDRLEIHTDALTKGDKVLVVDDLVATGGTLLAGVKLVQQLGGIVVGTAAIIDMPELGGREKLKDCNYHYLVVYEGH